jgi:glycosyltransferase involved in cell wall biosynthesis
MNVLIISQHYWPETFRINEVAESLMDAGCRVTVLAGQPNYPAGVVFDGYRASAVCTQAHPDAGYAIHRVPLVPRGRGSALRMVANYLSFMVSASVIGPWSLRGKEFDVVFIYAVSPILQAVPGIVIKRFKKAALVTWVQDQWPQSLEATGYVRNPRLLALVKPVVRWIYRRSDLLLVQSDAFIAPVEELASGTPVACHPNPGELAFSRLSSAADAPSLTLRPGFNVVFAGNMGTVQALDTVLDAAERLLAQPGIRFVLVGSGSRSDWLAEQVAQRRLTNVQLAGRFPSDAMPGILAQASALLVTLARNPIMAQTIPSKVQAYLAAGRPVVAALDGEGARIVLAAGAGLACPAEDAAALADAVLRLRKCDEASLAAMGDAGRRYYAEHFEPARLAARLKEHFSRAASLVKGRRGQHPTGETS